LARIRDVPGASLVPRVYLDRQSWLHQVYKSYEADLRTVVADEPVAEGPELGSAKTPVCR
jgi:hypothetical protein